MSLPQQLWLTNKEQLDLLASSSILMFHLQEIEWKILYKTIFHHISLCFLIYLFTQCFIKFNSLSTCELSFEGHSYTLFALSDCDFCSDLSISLRFDWYFVPETQIKCTYSMNISTLSILHLHTDDKIDVLMRRWKNKSINPLRINDRVEVKFVMFNYNWRVCCVGINK